MPIKKAKSKIKIKKAAKPKIALRKKKPVANVTHKEGKLIGRVTHYFDHIKVGVVKLSGPLAKGDAIRVVGGENTDFDQEASSLQIDHQEVKKAKKGDAVGLEMAKKVREGYRVYKV